MSLFTRSTVKFVIDKILDIPFYRIPIYYIPVAYSFYCFPRETFMIGTSIWLFNSINDEDNSKPKNVFDEDSEYEDDSDSVSENNSDSDQSSDNEKGLEDKKKSDSDKESDSEKESVHDKESDSEKDSVHENELEIEDESVHDKESESDKESDSEKEELFKNKITDLDKENLDSTPDLSPLKAPKNKNKRVSFDGESLVFENVEKPDEDSIDNDNEDNISWWSYVGLSSDKPKND